MARDRQAADLRGGLDAQHEGLDVAQRPGDLRVVAEVAAALGAGATSAELWRASAAAWEAVERVYRIAVAQAREAEAEVAADDREAAARAAGAALETGRRLGAGWLAGEVEGLVARARLRVDDDGDGAAVGDGAPDAEGEAAPAEDPFGLTPRERQVLALVARGATNRQIGAQLYMAEKTASVHVSRILAKLDVRSRTQAAAVAHRLGLAD